MNASSKPPRRGRVVKTAMVVLAGAVLVGGGWFAGSRVRSPSQAAAQAAAPKPSLIGVPVEYRKLSQTVIVRGDVRPSVSVAVGVPGSVADTPVVTAVFAKRGDSLVEGQRVIEVSGRPVFVVQGVVPVYRDLKPGMSGTDVAQLQAALGRLGCSADGDGVYGEATKACVDKLYTEAGYVPIPTTLTERADLTAADNAVVDAHGALDSATSALAKAAKTPTGSAVLEATDAVKVAQRNVDTAAADARSSIQKAQADLNAAVAARDRLNGDPEAAQADRDAATAAVPAVQLALSDARRNAKTAQATAADALQLAKMRYTELLASPDTSAETKAVEQAQAALDTAGKARADLQASTGPPCPRARLSSCRRSRRDSTRHRQRSAPRARRPQRTRPARPQIQRTGWSPSPPESFRRQPESA